MQQYKEELKKAGIYNPNTGTSFHYQAQNKPLISRDAPDVPHRESLFANSCSCSNVILMS